MMAQPYKFIIELHAPKNPENIPNYVNTKKNLFSHTKSVSIASKSFCDSISGFDFSYNLASYLLDRDGALDILFHVTCYDLNMVTIRTRLTLLKQLGIKKILVVSGDMYEQSSNIRLRKLQYANSHELAGVILRDFNWFDSIGVAGYPGGNGKDSSNDEEECDRLAGVLQLGVREVYTQCVFDSKSFGEFSRIFGRRFPAVGLVPSVALFKSLSNLELISKLTRVTNVAVKSLEGSLKTLSLQEAEFYSISFIEGLCLDLLHSFSKRPIKIDLCTFGHFDLAQTLMDRLSKLDRTKVTDIWVETLVE